MILTLLLFFFFVTDATIYVGGLDDKVTDTLLWELFVQAGSVGRYSKTFFQIKSYRIIHFPIKFQHDSIPQ